MNIGMSCGWTEDYWKGWPFAGMYGGSEHLLVETAAALADAGHAVTVRLPRPSADREARGVCWIGSLAPSRRYDVLFCFDDYAQKDRADREVLVACRSDPPIHTDWDQMVFLSKHHAKLMGYPDCPAVGGGVNLALYRSPLPRVPRRVICTSSPDRCPAATTIGSGFDFVQTYKPVGGVGTEYSREDLVCLQQTAMVLIYPLDPRRPSDFFSMAVLEALAAGTPVVVSDADSMPELWKDCSLMLPLPVDLGVWSESVERLLTDRQMWQQYSAAGRKKAREYTWPSQAARLLRAASA